MPSHTAVDTLLASEGVCRDYAHLVIALCRAVGFPARLVSVYAPGLTPMDFHAVAEVRTAAGWQILDATRLAPRATLLRIATGRDAADTAFASTIRGDVELRSAEVWATTDGDLPHDDHLVPVRLG
jgi:transglutaminase-like putative cysteine protease